MPAKLEIFVLTSTYQLRIGIRDVLYFPLSRLDPTGYHIMIHEDWGYPGMDRGTLNSSTSKQGYDRKSWIGGVGHTDSLASGISHDAGWQDIPLPNLTAVSVPPYHQICRLGPI
jgi:hypothetical protein